MADNLTQQTAGKYFIITYGCQMNAADSEIMAGILSSLGYIETQSETDADVVVINTCVVRAGAEDRALGRLANLVHIKQQRPGMTVILAGCLAQKDGEKLIGDMPIIDIIIGTRDMYDLKELLARHLHTGEHIIATGKIDQPVFLDGSEPVIRRSGLKGLVTIMYGCNNFCSYCIVPTTRGRETSRPPCDIIAEIKMLAARGYREVQLLGQNVNSYKYDDVDFPRLLALVSEVEGIERIRFITSHPKDLSDELINAMATLPKVCEGIHLPAQAGNDRVLRTMNRKYTSAHYRGLIAKLRAAMPDIVISTDLIVGFPGETDDEFKDTLRLVRDIRWNSAFMFMYSPRPRTRAAEIKETVADNIKKARLQKLIELQESISLEENRKWVGRTVEVLAESTSLKRSNELIGRTRGDLPVVFAASKDLIGQFAQVEIVDAFAHTLHGKLLTIIKTEKRINDKKNILHF